jgi:hypothetical protein
MAQWLTWGNGHDGSPNSISGTVNTYAACTGTAGQTVLTTALAANDGDQILIHQTRHASAAGTWEVVKVLSDAGATLNLYTALVNSYSTGAQAVLIPQYTGGTISGAVTDTNWDGTIGGIIAILSNGDLTISGSLTANGGYIGGGSVGGNSQGGKRGEGTTGNPQTQGTTANGSGGGGGGADPNPGNGAGGGGGGYASSGTAGSKGEYGASNVVGAAGTSVGTAALTTILLGSGGGSGGTDNGGGNGGAGGNGGGMVFIFAKNITISGTVNTNGTIGGSGGTYDGGGGGGAGGSILIKTQVAVLGTNKATSSAGSGGAGGSGTGSSSPNYANGGAGSVGRIRCDYFTSVSGSTTPSLSSAQDLTLNIPSSNFFMFL